MARAFVLMTAMPPTKGHFNLMNFASRVSWDGERARVLVCTQPQEPFVYERFIAVRNAAYRTNGVDVVHQDDTPDDDPNDPDFWPKWDAIMLSRGFKPGDYVVTSEAYGQTLADRLGGIFIPYDPQRELYYTKATLIRDNLKDYFHDILPEFQKYLRTTITVFGAESTGKTTLSHQMSYDLNGHWLFEWARPYLELVGPEINIASMEDIWRGQLATQKHADQMFDKPFVIQDTDLFSTVGYWEQPHWQDALGPVPDKLVEDALATKSDLYIITKSNIPFEEDPIRYGGDKRESPDEFWIGIAEKYDLNYVVLSGSDFELRRREAKRLAMQTLEFKALDIEYTRLQP